MGGIENNEMRIDKDWVKPSIHPSYARILCSYLINKGYDAQQLFAGSTLNWETLLKQQRFISLAQYQRIVQNALNLTQTPWLGIEVARLLQVSMHGSLGYGAVTAPVVSDAFKLIEQALITRISILSFEYKATDYGARFYIHEIANIQSLSEVVYPMLLGAFCDIIEKMTGSAPQGVVVNLAYDKPTWYAHYQQQFPEFEFHFGQQAFSLDIPEKLLSMHSLTADDFAYRNALRECNHLMEVRQLGGALPERVKHYLFNHDIRNQSQTQVAKALGLSVRSLIRKLQAENTSFQAILDEVRTELSCWHLQNSNLTIEQVAENVGYIDTSNFSRVFKRWMQCTPSAFRKQC